MNPKESSKLQLLRRIERNPRSELGQTFCMVRDLLQQTAREQDMLDGGNGRTFYRYTLRDAIDLAWEEGEPSNLNIRKLFDQPH